VRELSSREALQLVWGATLFATGGGGNPMDGIKLVEQLYSANLAIRLIEPHELKEGVAVSPYFVGSVKKGGEVDIEALRHLLRRAADIMASSVGEKISATVATELGGLNTTIALYCATLLGVPSIDGDLMGRAGPELHQSTAHVKGIPVTPAVIATLQGDVITILAYSSVDAYESMARHVSVLGNDSALVMDTPLMKDGVRDVVVEGTLGRCVRLGELIMDRASPDRIARAASGFLVLEGIIDDVRLERKGGFLVGYIHITCEGQHKGETARIYVKNENIMVWLDGKPLVMPPDLFVLLDERSRPLTNGEVRRRMRVWGLAMPAPKVWRTGRGLELFGPRRFGFDLEYVEVERLLQSTPGQRW
jgi:DUF917 family protein